MKYPIVSRERENAEYGVGVPSASGGSTTGFRFRNQSPSNRRSRERSRREFNRSHNSDQAIATGALTYNEMTADGMNSFEDSRLSGKNAIQFICCAVIHTGFCFFCRQ